LLIEDWPFYVEPVDKSNRLLSQIWNQSGLKVLGIQGLLENRRVAPEILKLHHAQAPDPADRFPRKGDFYARWTGERAVPWVVRGVSPFRKSSESDGLTPTGLQLKQLQSRKTEWKGLVWGPSRPVPTIQTFSAGYQMFQVKEASVVFWEEGRWNDGWMGKNAVCRIGMTERAVPFRAILQAPPAGAPGRIQVFQEETRIAVREWSEPGAVSIPLILSATDAVGTRLRFELDRTFVPRQIGTGADDRALGVMLNIQKEPEFRWTDRWSDGWIGKHSVCHVFWPGRGPLTVRFSGDAIPRAVPQEIAVRGEGVPPQTVSIPSAGAFAFEVTAMPKKGPPRYIPIRLQAHRTVNPKALGQSADDRDLSVQISARRLPGTAGNLETTAAAEGTP
jgi:hypothetical protein